jgi:hypothetical protein
MWEYMAARMAYLISPWRTTSQLQADTVRHRVQLSAHRRQLLDLTTRIEDLEHLARPRPSATGAADPSTPA